MTHALSGVYQESRLSNGAKRRPPKGAAFARVQVLGKAVAILNLFTPERAELELHEIRRASRLPNSTCIRLVRNLVGYGLLSQRDGRYRIGFAVLRWAAVARERLGVVDLAAPIIGQLRDDVGETVGLYVRDGSYRVCVALAETPKTVAHRLSIGEVLPLHAGSTGKVLLAFDPKAKVEISSTRLERFTSRTIVSWRQLELDLERVRAQGYATSLGERDLELNGMAAPVFGPQGELVAALGIAGPAQRMTPDAMRRFVLVLLKATNSISRGLGYTASRKKAARSA